MNAVFVSDLHLPYEHPDALDFVLALQETYEPEHTIQIGDFVDLHQQSFHDKHPECLGARAEFDAAREKAEAWAPIIDVVTEGNHCMRPQKVAKKFGLLPEMLVDKGTLWGVPFVSEFWLTLDDKTRVLCRHGDSGFPRHGTAARRFTHHTCTGHHHVLGGVQHYTLMDGTRRWMASGGALIDPTSPAFAYTPHKPVLGAVVIWDDTPLYEPMKLDKHGRWTGKL